MQVRTCYSGFKDICIVSKDSPYIGDVVAPPKAAVLVRVSLLRPCRDSLCVIIVYSSHMLQQEISTTVRPTTRAAPTLGPHGQSGPAVTILRERHASMSPKIC